MMHWKVKAFLLGIFLSGLSLAGCSKPCCLQDFDQLGPHALLPQDLSCNPNIVDHLATENPNRAPRTVNDTDATPRYITLSECIALALENGTVGSQSLRTIFNSVSILNTGTVFFGNLDDLGSFNGNQLVGSDSIRAFSVQPAIAQTDMEASLARYDAVARSFLGFNSVDFPTSDAAVAQQNGQFARFGIGVEKALPTGGVAGITFGNTVPGSLSNADFQSAVSNNFYSRFNTPNVFGANGYTPDLRIAFSQPLLKFFGPDINSLLVTHPLSPAQQLLGSAAATAQPIILSRVTFKQSRAEFERLVNYMVGNVEASYFQLYALYMNLYSTEQAMRQAHAVWKISKAKYEAGQVAITGYAQTRAQYEDFRAQRIQAASKVLEQERILRLLCGLPVEDGYRLIPVDTPTVDQYIPDWDSALKEAMTLRPELTIARLDVERRQLELIRERNNLLPDVRLEAGYNIHGFGNRLDGNGAFLGGATDNAFRSLADTNNADFNIGLIGSMPLGFRAQHAGLRAANLRLAQSYYVLRDQENKARNNLTVAYRQVIADYEVIRANRAGREAAAEQVEARYKEYLAGKTTVDFLLTAQQTWAQALSKEYQSISNYNVDLAAFQFAKGTLLQHNNIQIAEAGLPACIQGRAIENERQRAQAIVCRERPAVAPACEKMCQGMPIDGAPSLPALMMDKNSNERVDKFEAPASSDTVPAAPMAPDISRPMPTVPTTMPTIPTAPGTMPTTPAAPSALPWAPASGGSTPPAPLNLMPTAGTVSAPYTGPALPNNGPIIPPPPPGI